MIEFEVTEFRPFVAHNKKTITSLVRNVAISGWNNEELVIVRLDDNQWWLIANNEGIIFEDIGPFKTIEDTVYHSKLLFDVTYPSW